MDNYAQCCTLNHQTQKFNKIFGTDKLFLPVISYLATLDFELYMAAMEQIFMCV